MSMKLTASKIKSLILIIGIMVALFAGGFSAYLSYKSGPVTESATQESKISNETKSTMVTGVLSLVFKNGLDLVQVMRNSN